MAEGEQRTGGLAEWWNGGMVEWQNGWQNGGMAGMATYLPHLWYTPTTPTPTPFSIFYNTSIYQYIFMYVF
jgi:hypothetical protein